MMFRGCVMMKTFSPIRNGRPATRGKPSLLARPICSAKMVSHEAAFARERLADCLRGCSHASSAAQVLRGWSIVSGPCRFSSRFAEP
jgi:hypothetical protein